MKPFLRAGILSGDGQTQATIAGTPQGGILSPLLANVALTVLDEHFAAHWQTNCGTDYQRTKRRPRWATELQDRPLRRLMPSSA